MEHTRTVEIEDIQCGFDSHHEDQGNRWDGCVALSLGVHYEAVELGLIGEQSDTVGKFLDRQVEEVRLHLNLKLGDDHLGKVGNLEV